MTVPTQLPPASEEPPGGVLCPALACVPVDAGYLPEIPQKVGRGKEELMGTLLWIAAVVLVIAGIVTLIQGSILLGIVLIVVGLLVGPGGVSLFNGRGHTV